MVVASSTFRLLLLVSGTTREQFLTGEGQKIMRTKQRQDTLRNAGDGEVPVGFYAGVDTHSDTHTIAVLDGVGRTVMTGTYPATVRPLCEAMRCLPCTCLQR